MRNTAVILLKLSIHFISLIILISTLIFLTFLWWQLLGKWYLNLPNPVGGDYYVGLTYAIHFAKHLPLPPAGWLEFWNAGVPVVGGYQWFPFYLAAPLNRFFYVYTALDIFSIGAILLYILAAHLLFYQVSKNHLVALSLSLVNITSQAAYFQLVVGGMITGSSMQFYLPLSLFFLFRYFESPKRIRSFLASGIVGAFAVLHHPAMSLLFVIMPILAMFLAKLILSKTSKRHYLTHSGLYLFLLMTIGSMGIMPFLFQMSFTEIASRCESPQCWGIYPFHIERWLGWLPVSLLIYSTILVVVWTVLRKIFKHQTSLKSLLPTLFGLLAVSFYPVAAYFKLIPTLSNSLFPRRMFWAILVLALVFVAQVFRMIGRSNRYVSWLLAVIILLFILRSLPIEGQPLFNLNLKPALSDQPPNVVPDYVYRYIIPKYLVKDETNFLPTWIPKEEFNYRFDSLNASVIHWWNVVNESPSTRGYTSGFNKQQFVWSYYLQTALHKNQQEQISDELIKNRAQFLFDAYAIRYLYTQDYHSVVDSGEFISDAETTFRGISPEFTSPIISTTNAPPILFIGDDQAYDTFIRVLSDINFNSRRLIPVKGPKNLSNVSTEDLNKFPFLFLYRYDGNLKKVDGFVKNGGKVFIEVGSLTKLPPETDNIFPFKNVKINPVTSWQLEKGESELVEDIDVEKFAPPIYQGTPWKLAVIPNESLPSNIEVLLSQESDAVLTRKTYGNGEIFISGLNLPYHLVENQNPEEAKLFTNILSSFSGTILDLPTADITRPYPELITITGQNFKGVYFKENFHPGWRAYVADKPTKIFQAGLGFMFIQVPKQSASQVRLKFEGSTGMWALFYLSIVTLVLTIIAMIAPKKVTHLLLRTASPIANTFHRFRSKLKADEHEQY